MDLLERYVQAVGRYLSPAAREDTLAELRANLLEQMDARSEELGHPLTEADASAILQAHGRPEVVAARYLAQRSLIGPGLFPTYLFTLRNVLPFVIFVYCIVQSVPLITMTNSAAVVSHVVKAVFQFVPTLLIFWATVTLVFAVFEYAQSQLAAGNRWSACCAWDPAKLPAVKSGDGGARPKPLTNRVADLTFHCLWMLYVVAVPAHPFIVLGPGVFYLNSLGVRFAPIWHTFLLLLVALLLVQLAAKGLAVYREGHPWIRPLNLAANVIGVVACGLLASTPEYFVPAGTTTDLHRLAVVNHAMALAFRVALLFAVIGLLTDGWKSIKRLIPTQRFAF